MSRSSPLPAGERLPRRARRVRGLCSLKSNEGPVPLTPSLSPLGRGRRPRPVPVLINRLVALFAVVCIALAAPTAPASAADAAFQAWLEALWPDAPAFGLSRKTFDAATRRGEPGP